MGWHNPVVSGTILRTAAIQSPGYVPGTGGWTINQDGSAVFQLLTIIQGLLSGLNLDSSSITNSTFVGDILSGSVIHNSIVISGTMTETTITLDDSGGILRVYATVTTTVTQNVAGTYTITFPADTVSAKIEAWGGGPGGNGGSTSEGGSGGGGGEYACEPNYPVTGGQTYTYIVGSGGNGSSTGGGNGNDGGDSFFDNTGVHAHGGNGDGTPGTGSSNSIHYDGGSGGAASGFSGGASGANSGDPTAAGFDGISSTGSTGAARPGAQAYGGRGGSGGNSGSNGGTGGSPGSGGGGAGKGSTSTGTKTKTYYPIWTASYYGPDADSSVANNLRSTSTLYQGGETASGGSFNGNQRFVFAFNVDQIVDDFVGYSASSLVLTVHNEHSWNNSGMSIEFDYRSAGSLPGSPPSSWPAGMTEILTGTIAEGSTHSYSLGSSIAAFFINHNGNALGIGANVPSNHPYDLNYYGYFSTSISITITGTKTVSGSVTAGNGTDGQVQITYITSQELIAAISPASGSDSAGNGYEQGYTGQVTAFQPGSVPQVPETWHDAVLMNGWTNHSTFPCQYRFKSDNEIEIIGRVNGSVATGPTIFLLTGAYVPNNSFFVCAAYDFNDTANTYGIYAQTSGAVQAIGPSTTPSDLNFHGYIPVVTNSS